MEITRDFQWQLKKWMSENNIRTQRQLADSVEVNEATVSRWFTNSACGKKLSNDVIEKLSSLGFTPESDISPLGPDWIAEHWPRLSSESKMRIIAEIVKGLGL